MGFEAPIVKQTVSVAAALVTTRATRSSRRGASAAHSSIHKNISIAETCRFYGVADSLSTCRVPRSCYDCLQLPHCVLGFDGRCDDVSESWVPQAHDAIAQAPSTQTMPLVNEDPWAFFFGSNATYCNSSDPICRDCRATFESFAAASVLQSWLAKQYCLGVDKCVCLGICEVPAVWATSRVTYDCAPAPVDANPRRSKLSSASSVHRDPRAPLQQLVNHRKPETCEFYGAQDVQGCRTPRSCRDCLETEGCMIKDHKCVSMEKYDVALDYRNATRPVTSFACTFDWNGSAIVPKEMFLYAPGLQFPSTNTTYCPHSDGTCAMCRARFALTALDWSVDIERVDIEPRQCYSTNTTYCVGSGGCVCIEQCEDMLLHSQDPVCFSKGKFIGLRLIVLIPTIVILFIALVASMVWNLIHSRPVGGYRRAARQAAMTAMRHVIDHAPTLHLDLYGWRQFQERLLEKEQELLSGAENVSPVSRPVDFEFGGPTAPDFDEDDSSAPTATDPHALASAPLYWGANPPETHDPTIPTAPDLTDL